MNIRKYLKDFYLKFTIFRWTVGVGEYDTEAVLSSRKSLRIHWIKDRDKRKRGSWFADPFILSEDKTHLYILVEELFYYNNKGRISRLTVDKRTWMLEKVDPIIDIATHLSFPAYFRDNGKVYIYPESTKSGKLTLYEYDEGTGASEPVRDLCSAPLADAVIFNISDRQYIMATTSPGDNGKVMDVYPLTEESPADKPELQVHFGSNVARNAGMPFKVGDTWYRPAQDCTRSYGRNTVIQRMTMTDGAPRFEDVKRFRSKRFNYWEAFHTFNVFEDRYIAVDAEGFKYGIPAMCSYYVRNFLRRS